MKAILPLCLAALAIAPAQAQVFRPEAGRRDHSPARVQVSASAHSPYVYRGGPRVHVDVGYSRGHHGRYGHWGHDRHRGHWGHTHWGYSGWRYPQYSYYAPRYYVPSYGYYTGYGDGYPYYSTGYYGSGSAAANGLVLGALAGGIIGHNSGEFRHNGWRGAAWGAGLGWLLGTVVDANRRPVVYPSAPGVMSSVQPVQVQAQPVAAQAQPVTIINNYYNSSTPMSGANGLFGR